MICSACGGAVPRSAYAVHEVAVIVAPQHVRETGLLAWATAIVGPFRVDGMAVRHAESGELTVVWPRRKDSRGGLHPTFAVLDDHVRRSLEAAVLAAFLREVVRRGRDR
ncbi:MAG TPA: hypothetical protein VEI02_14020 [Planctomycetota bacterium]|nr:hypothetical protein [Planctomycetota bacterium]